eukprot:TRINITY_DN39558_c0_g1_i1.p1 TRINITY_DN39558_c0_g1~~TRINITY_DN39558_c0_g1_i1.p1  ORF type:complete len:106 (+),score=39.54 TRINITY_DN39558_c0_g1_i1:37-354(+)
MMLWLVFFFKQKTAYEMLRSLVGSEMCIRDSPERPCRTNQVVMTDADADDAASSCDAGSMPVGGAGATTGSPVDELRRAFEAAEELLKRDALSGLSGYLLSLIHI